MIVVQLQSTLQHVYVGSTSHMDQLLPVMYPTLQLSIVKDERYE